MILYVFLHTNALGCESHDRWIVSPDDLEKGIYLSSLLPESYLEYVKAIHVKISEDGNTVVVTSDYGSKEYSIDEDQWWSSPRIGLSYAWCEVSLHFVPEFRPTWDLLRVTHQGATETFQREEIKDDVWLDRLSPRLDGSLIPWLHTKVSSQDYRYVGLLEEGHRHIQLRVGKEPAEGEFGSYELWSFSTIITEWDPIEQKPVTAIVDTRDLNDSINDAAAALRVAEQIQEQRPEHLEFIAQYMTYAADLGSKDAEAWLRDYHEEDDSKYHPFV